MVLQNYASLLDIYAHLPYYINEQIVVALVVMVIISHISPKNEISMKGYFIEIKVWMLNNKEDHYGAKTACSDRNYKDIFRAIG